ncbi:MAG: hypothetical protein K8R60_06450 [Burkholderiales bacterium]|nr:hypothetical protein [Burkholderiales bacterium]
MIRSPRACLTTLAFLAVAAGNAHAQWRPTGALAAVPVIRECDETGGDIAVSRLDPPTIYVCPRVVELARKSDPGVEHFYLVHEYGHIALATADEAAADCWAARELAKAPNGERYLSAAIRHFRRRGDEASRRYGTPVERAERLRSCADSPSQALPTSTS